MEGRNNEKFLPSLLSKNVAKNFRVKLIVPRSNKLLFKVLYCNKTAIGEAIRQKKSTPTL